MEKLKVQVDEKPLTVDPKATSGASDVIDPGLQDNVAAMQSDVNNLKTDVGTLKSDVLAMRTTGPVRIKVLGFEPNGTALLAERRDSLLSEFRAALAKVPSGRTPNVLFVGFADPSGNLNRNVSLALRRAATVSEFLRRQDLGRAFHGEVTSGGVVKQGAANEARRVEIVISKGQSSLLLTSWQRPGCNTPSNVPGPITVPLRHTYASIQGWHGNAATSDLR